MKERGKEDRQGQREIERKRKRERGGERGRERADTETSNLWGVYLVVPGVYLVVPGVYLVVPTGTRVPGVQSRHLEIRLHLTATNNTYLLDTHTHTLADRTSVV